MMPGRIPRRGRARLFGLKVSNLERKGDPGRKQSREREREREGQNDSPTRPERPERAAPLHDHPKGLDEVRRHVLQFWREALRLGRKQA